MSKIVDPLLNNNLIHILLIFSGVIKDHNLLPLKSMFFLAGAPFIVGSLFMAVVIKWNRQVRNNIEENVHCQISEVAVIDEGL